MRIRPAAQQPDRVIADPRLAADYIADRILLDVGVPDGPQMRLRDLARTLPFEFDSA